MRVILEWREDSASMLDQLNAARRAVHEQILEGELWGVKVNGSYFGVKRNKQSIRVYPQDFQTPNNLTPRDGESE